MQDVLLVNEDNMFKWIKMVTQGWYRRIFNITSEESKRRLEICMSCDDKIKIGKEYICGHCGCPIKSATLADDKHCSINKW